MASQIDGSHLEERTLNYKAESSKNIKIEIKSENEALGDFKQDQDDFVKTEEFNQKCSPIQKILIKMEPLEADIVENTNTPQIYSGEQCTLKRHNSERHDREDTIKYQCNICFYNTTCKSNLEVHQLKVHKSDSEMEWHYCKLCGFKAKLSLYIKRHHNKVHKSGKEITWYTCDKCSYKSKLKSKIELHTNQVHSSGEDIKWFCCDRCDYKTKIKTILKIHVISKHAEPLIKCELCDYKTNLARHLTRHILNKHSSADQMKSFEHTKHSGTECKTFKCESCTFDANNLSALRRHVLVMHSSTNKSVWNYCVYCKYKSQQKKNLLRHLAAKHEL